MITMQDKMKDMENREIALKADNDKLKSEVEVYSFLLLDKLLGLRGEKEKKTVFAKLRSIYTVNTAVSF